MEVVHMRRKFHENPELMEQLVQIVLPMLTGRYKVRLPLFCLYFENLIKLAKSSFFTGALTVYIQLLIQIHSELCHKNYG